MQKAVEKHKGFLEKEFGEQRDLIDAMAQEIVPIVDLNKVKEEEKVEIVDNPPQNKENDDKKKIKTL